MSSNDSVKVWIKSSVATNYGDLELVLDDTAACGSTIGTLDVPALVADTWKLAVIASTSTNANLSTVRCVGLNVVIDNGVQTVRMDDMISDLDVPNRYSNGCGGGFSDR